MAKGFLSGAVVGTVVAVAGLGTLSVLEQNEAEQRDTLAEAVRELAEQPVTEAEADSAAQEVTPERAAVEEPATEPGVDVEADKPEVATEDPEAEVAQEPSDTEAAEPSVQETAEAPEEQTDEPTAVEEPEVEQPDPDTAEGTANAPQPETFEPVETVTPGETSNPARAPEDVTEVAPDATAPVLDTPETGTDTNPDDVIAAPTPAPETGDAVAALTEPDTSNEPDAPSQIASVSPVVPPSTTLATPEPEVGLNVVTEPADPPAAPEEPAATPETETETETASVDTPEPAERTRPQVRQLVPTTPASEASEENVESAALARPAIGQPAGSLIDRNTQSASRLPTIGATPDTADAGEATSETTGDTRPLERFAASVEIVDPNLPRMAIVLLDDGTGPLGPDTLDNFPFPVTFALDPLLPDVADRMSGYRAKGYEVATLANLPAGAQPSDVEQILAGAVAAVPESVVLVEAPGGGLQFDRASTEQTAAFVAESGHGLVLLPNGLNTAEAIARRENVPTVSVLRDFDGDGQDARTKRRFLDGAAFRARQDGNVVMLGRLTADTVSALLLWSLQDRASSVTMVPVSAILTDPSD